MSIRITEPDRFDPDGSLSGQEEVIYVPLAVDKLILGKKVNFDIYLKSESPGEGGSEYTLYCTRGGVFSPGLLKEIKDKGILRVYYHPRHKDQVLKYLNWSPVGTETAEAADWFERRKSPSILDVEGELSTTTAQYLEVQGFIPLAVQNLAPGWEVTFDVFLKTKTSGEDDPGYIICCPQGAVFEASWVEKLKEKGITRVYCHSRDQGRVLQYLHHNLGNILADENLSLEQKAERVYEVTLFWTRRFFLEEPARAGAQIKLGLEFVNHLFDCIHRDKYDQRWLLDLCRHDGTLYTHCLNTCLLGLAFTKYLEWPERKVLDFGMGALLHDIGMIKVSPAVLRKSGRLSKTEMEQVKKHPLEGFRLLKGVSPLKQDSLEMILQHHERGDGSGYPNGIKLPLINTWGRLLRIIDSYEALTSRRSWRQSFDPLQALWIMRQEWQTSGFFDTDYLVEFIKFLSVT